MSDAMKDLAGVSDEQIHELILEGKLKDMLRWHRLRQILACNEIIDSAITKMELLGFSPVEVYYAIRQQMYFTKFGLEDMGMGGWAAKIDAEIDTEMADHRIKYSSKVMRENHAKTQQMVKDAKAQRLRELEAERKTD